MNDPSILDRWEEIDTLFRAALDQPPDQRVPFVEEHTPDDGELRKIVLSLLEQGELADRESFTRAALARALSSLDADGDEAVEGLRLGRYRLISPIGRGGSGTVYLAERDDGEFRQQVAVKLLRRGLDTDDILARFRAERQILASINHPNIARLLDGGASDDGRPYLVMELVEGEPITTYCDRRRLTIDERLALFDGVAGAVDCAHRHLVIHRDLKPDNILVTVDGTVKLLDFGIAKLLDDSPLDGGAPPTRAGFRPMTPAYASPEQVTGERMTTASDVYQLGLVLYELCAGRLPPERWDRRGANGETSPPPSAALSAGEATAGEVSAAELAERRGSDLRRLRARLRGDLDTIVTTALHRHPERRYATVQQLASDLALHRRGHPISARPDDWLYRARRFAARHRAGVAVAAAAVLAMLGYLATLSLQAERLEAERNLAHAEATKARQVTDFLVGLFEGADPSVARGEELTARELLDRGLLQMDGLPLQPEVQAELLTVMGRVYRSLGHYDPALTLAERALELRRGVHGEEHASVAQSLEQRGSVLLRRGDPAGAEEMHGTALEMRKRLLGEAHPDVAESLNNLGVARRGTGDLEGAEALLREALTMRRELLGDLHPAVAQSLSNLGLVLRDRGEIAAAEEAQREALDIRRAVLDPGDPDLAASLNNLGQVLRERGDVRGTEELVREALGLLRRRLGDEHPDVATALNNHAILLRQLGDLEGAEASHREALAIRRRVLGEAHPSVASSLTNLGQVLRTRGMLDEAEARQREALALIRSIRGAEHAEVALALNNLGMTLRERGDLPAAEEAQRQALAMRSRLFGDGHPDVAQSLSNLAQVLIDRGAYAEAETALREAMRATLATFGEGHPRVASIQGQLDAVAAGRRDR